MANKCCDKSTRLAGVTLIELLLVMAVIVVVLGLAVPTFFDSLRVQHLRSAADQLRVDLSKARNRAMTSGLTLGMSVSEQSYLITVATDLADENEASTTTPTFELTQQLPEGIKLTLAAANGISTSPAPGGTAMDNFIAGATTQTGDTAVYFYPDGTTSTVEFQLSNDKQESLVVSLRGITGVALVQDAPSQTQGQIVAEFPAAQEGATP
jgi:Tfp pilus assembly protein FimT